jgi:cytidylate kinase
MSEWYLKLVDGMLGRNRFVEEMNEVPVQTNLIFKPIITVSRDPGSGGAPIAKIVSQKLGFTFYNKKLVTEVAKSAKAREGIIQDIDEKQRSLMEDFIQNSLNPEYVSEQRYMKNLAKVILAINQHGKAVILGRGSNFMVPAAFALRVRVTAPYRVCVARAVQYEGVPYSRAREIINKVMAERAGFVKQYFSKDISNPKYYDLTLNTAYMTIEDAVHLVITAFKRKFP